MVTPVDFPQNLLAKYKEWNGEYVLSAPVKAEEAKLLVKLVPLDIRFLLGCGLKWDDNIVHEDPSASGGAC